MNITMERTGRRVLLGKIVAASMATVIATGVVSESTASARPAPSVTYTQVGTYNPQRALTPAQAHEWRLLTNTPAKREKVMLALAASYKAAGAKVTTKDPVASTSVHRGVRPHFAWGVSSDHVWITMSYLDIAYGAINTAVSVCKTKLPGWLCSGMGDVLRGLANGWGYGASHGLWAAAYWWSYPHVTYGRW